MGKAMEEDKEEVTLDILGQELYFWKLSGGHRRLPKKSIFDNFQYIFDLNATLTNLVIITTKM